MNLPAVLASLLFVALVALTTAIPLGHIARRRKDHQ